MGQCDCNEQGSSLWEQYLGLLRQIKASTNLKRARRLAQNAQGLARRFLRDYNADVAAYPNVVLPPARN